MNDKYVKKSLLGKGGRGTVWLVENKDAGMPAALKWYEDGRKEAEREREILRRFGGKGIPYLIDYIENEQGAGIVMEYVEGKSLRTLLKEQKIWSEKEAAALVMKAAGILAVFHRQVPMIIYGDIKPENIMVTTEGEVCFIDFGSVLYEGEKERGVFGTKEYLPPSEGEKISAYRDTYGLGIILYEMLTGCVLSKGIGDKKADISHLSPDCRRIMQKAVKIHETEGYASGGEMYEDLKTYMEGLDKERKERRKHMFKRKSREKKEYFISDLKRLVRTGYVRVICLILMGMAVAGIAWKGNEVKGADMGETSKEEIVTEESSKEEMVTEEASKEEMTIERVVVRNYMGKYAGEDVKKEEGVNGENPEGKTKNTIPGERETAEIEKANEIEKTDDIEKATEGEKCRREVPRDEYGRKLIVKE